MRYLVLALLLVGCGNTVETVKIKENPQTQEVIRKAAYANCVKEKESEVDHSTEASRRYSWQPEEIKEYCEENWRGYRD